MENINYNEDEIKLLFFSNKTKIQCTCGKVYDKKNHLNHCRTKFHINNKDNCLDVIIYQPTIYNV